MITGEHKMIKLVCLRNCHGLAALSASPLVNVREGQLHVRLSLRTQDSKL